MNIETFQHEAAYRAGLEVYDGLAFEVALERLKPTGLNPSSAKFLLYGVIRMMKGKCYKRALNTAATSDFLTWIRRDRGDDALRNAVKALGLHIDYYEAHYNVHRRSLRELLKKHSALLPPPADGMILMEWKDAESNGYIDEFPLDWFENESIREGVIHLVRNHSGSEENHAKCDVTVNGLQADLDYERYAAFNEKEEMHTGVARLHFSDTDRTRITEVEWKPAGEDSFTKQPFEISGFEIPPSPPYSPPEMPDEKSPASVRLRPGQAAFRRKIKALYNNRCCMSGCAVLEVLEAAHIDPYIAAGSDHPANGLLLRSDLHTLFDKHLICINPNTSRIEVSVLLHQDPAYAALHDKSPSLPGHPSHHPHQDGLHRRWALFQETGTPDR